MLVDALVTETLGATSVTMNVKLVLAVEPSALVAVIVTLCLPSSRPDCDQLHVPLWLPAWLMVPCEAVSSAERREGAKRPAARAVPVSAMLVDALVSDTLGATSVTVNVKLRLPGLPSALVAVLG